MALSTAGTSYNWIMNPFISDYPTRSQAWKQVRDQVAHTGVITDKLDTCLKFWRQAPEEHVRINWDDASTWPGAWELIHDNAYCASSVSLGIAYTLLLADAVTFNDVTLRLLWDKPNHMQRVVVHTQGWYLNWGYVDRQPESQLKHVLTQDTWCWQQKQWQSTRPK